MHVHKQVNTNLGNFLAKIRSKQRYGAKIRNISLQSRAGFSGAGGHLLKQINEYDAAINQAMKKISYVINFNRADDARPNYKVCNVSNAKNMK